MIANRDKNKAKRKLASIDINGQIMTYNILSTENAFIVPIDFHIRTFII